MLQLHLSDRQFNYPLRCDLYQRLDGMSTCHHWCHQRLPSWQPPVLLLMTQLVCNDNSPFLVSVVWVMACCQKGIKPCIMPGISEIDPQPPPPTHHWFHHVVGPLIFLTHWGRGIMAAIFQMTFSNAFSWLKMFEFWLQFHWNLFLRVQLTIFQHCFR